MTFDIPIRAEDGSIKTTMTATDEQMRVILEFGLNFLVATGLAAAYGVKVPDTDELQQTLPFND